MFTGWVIGNTIILLVLIVWLLLERDPMETRTDSIAFDAGALTEAISDLVEPLPDKLTRTTRMAMYGSKWVVEYEADCTYRWSTGEKVLWDLLVALSGRGSVNLRHLADYYRGTDEWPLILKAIGALS